VASDYRLAWSRRARLDLSEIWLYLSEQASDEIADAQISKIHSACQVLERSPLRGRPRDELRRGLRSVLAQPYIVFYSVTDTMVEIARVLHGRRNLPPLFVDDM